MVKAAPKPVQQAASVTITGTGATNITAGDSYVVKGTASANLVGKTVVLATQDTSGWSDLTSATVAADSTFALSAPATSAGAGRALKVYAPATSTTLFAESSTATFNVYGWYYLTERTEYEGDYSEGGATINAIYYAKSVYESPYYYNTPYSVQFDLSRKCTTFAATIGWADTAKATSSGSFAVYKDSVLIQSYPGTKFGTGTPISLGINGALRLKLEVQATAGSGYMVFGDAKILCAF